jgi:3-phenylpropionate/trans-cinnamate dioxygenase ferredoxin component
MTEYIKVAKIEEIPPGGRLWHDFAEESVIIFNINGTYYCIADICSHDGGPLEDGPLDGFSVECPRHGACFDVRSGTALSMPATSPIPVYEVKVEDGFVYMKSPNNW